MKKELPKTFQNKIDKPINNSRKVFSTLIKEDKKGSNDKIGKKTKDKESIPNQ